ncbi:MAG: efflux RND transporter periplasmic adaptor subunit [Chloroflexi bacterium]|nr:efflux RND transporter periplasmic adaptor subunit [Chloroflexota bacterium]
MRKYLVPLLILVGLLGGVILIFFLINGSQPAPTLSYTVRRGTLSAVVRTTGKLEPVRSAKLSFKTADLVKKIYVRPGDYVPAGTLLMELDDTRLQRELAQAETQRDLARFNLSAAQERSRYEAATAPTPTSSPRPTPTRSPNFTPFASPPPVPPISPYYAAIKQMEQAEQAALQALANLETAKLYAPFEGTILTVELNEGDPVNSGTTAITFADLTNLQVRAEVDEIDVANVALGQTAQFTLDAFPARSFEGRLTLISPSPSQRQGSTIYPVIVAFTRVTDLTLRPGMAASLTITSFTKNNILVVPNRAIKTIGSRKYLSHFNTESRTEDLPVETGLTNGEETEIVSGISEGDRVVLSR